MRWSEGFENSVGHGSCIVLNVVSFESAFENVTCNCSEKWYGAVLLRPCKAHTRKLPLGIRVISQKCFWVTGFFFGLWKKVAESNWWLKQDSKIKMEVAVICWSQWVYTVVRDEMFAITGSSMVKVTYWVLYFRIRTMRGKRDFSWKLKIPGESDVGFAYSLVTCFFFMAISALLANGSDLRTAWILKWAVATWVSLLCCKEGKFCNLQHA